MAPVGPQTTTTLFQTLDKALADGADHIHLMISSPGGSVFHGLSAHNYLRGLSVPVTTYNFGSVDSIGVVIFCSGKNRVSVPHARFLIHGVSLGFNGQVNLDEGSLSEHLKSIKIDAENIAKVISDTCKKGLKDVEKDMLERTTLTPAQARDYGLVTKVEKDLFKGGVLYAIYENGQVFQSSQGMEVLTHSTGMQMNYSSPSVARNWTYVAPSQQEEQSPQASIHGLRPPLP